MNAQQIRETFLSFFESKGHKVVASSPIVVKDDPTLMFTNAGMNQFKDWFLGNEAPTFKRVVNSQKCLRVSGKHNDLEEVGVDTYHHTMFEMLGNWSFGDYFKEDAIAWAWELLTEVYKINTDRIYITVFGGDSKENLLADEEARAIWKKYISADRIIDGSKKDNFWEMGDTGPCGPCTEIHVDIRSDEERALVDGKTLVNNDHPQVIEIWNNVFMQFNRMANGQLIELPAKHVDTGMGFERLCMVLNSQANNFKVGFGSNYDTDVFSTTIKAIESFTDKKYTQTQDKKDIAFRVISDHIRAVSFAIADGQLPSNTGAGYVIRRILRRAVRYGYSFLGVQEAMIYRLVEVLANQMGYQFEELLKQKQLVEKVIKEEEEGFLRTLESGIKRVDDYLIMSNNIIESGSISEEEKKNKRVFEGKFAFTLLDTFGFPIDLTQLIASENGYTVDMDGFDFHLQEQKNRSRKATETSTNDWVVVSEGDSTEFVGYDQLNTQVRILRYRQVSEKNKSYYQLVLNKTPFYAESGGQVGDTGYLSAGDEKIFITDTKKENNLIIHLVEKLPSDLSASFTALVNIAQRSATAANHSATHLLHFALREVLGKHVEQKGSLVNAAYLRFDFSHFEKISDEQLVAIETLANSLVRANNELKEFRQMSIGQAKDMGAMALFGEKYGDKVRVIQFADSIELCGGTHVLATGQIGIIKIISESAVAAGVRRLEAYTGVGAEQYLREQELVLNEIKDLLKAPKDLPAAVKKLQEESTRLSKELEKLQREKALGLKGDLIKNIRTINGVNIIAEKVSLPAESIKDISFALKAEHDNLIVMLGAESDGKALISVLLTDDLVNAGKHNATTLIKELAKEIKGGGGGQAFYATAGGKEPEGILRALKKLEELV